MSGNVLYSPALQAPVSLTNPSGQVSLSGQFLAGSGQQALMPLVASVDLLADSPALAQAMATQPGALSVAGIVATVLRSTGTARVPGLGGVVFLGQAPSVGVIATRPQGAVKFVAGQYVWLNNLYWQQASGSAGPQQGTFNSMLPGLVANLNIAGIIMYFTWSQLEGAQGDYSKGETAIRTILSAVRSQMAVAGRTKPFMIAFRLMGIRTFGSGSTQQNNNNDWPSYVINNGWTVSTGTAGAQLTLSTPCVNAFVAMNQHYGDVFDSDPNVLCWSMHDESDLFPHEGISAVVPTSTQIIPLEISMIKSIKDHWPSTAVLATCNWFQGGTAEIPNCDLFIQQLRAYSPGGIWFGGPDPGVRNTTAQRVFRGAAGTTGDLRGKAVWFGMVQGVFLTSTSTTPPADIAASEIGPQVPNQVAGTFGNGGWNKDTNPYNQHGYMFGWNAGCDADPSFQYRWSNVGASLNGLTQLAVVNSMAGLTNTDTPSDIPLAAPGNFQMTHQEANAVSLAWDPVGSAASYKVYRASVGADGIVGTFNVVGTPTGTSFRDAGATGVTTPGAAPFPYVQANVYRWAVSTVNASGIEGPKQFNLDLWIYRAGVDNCHMQVNNLNYGGGTCNTGNTTHLQAGSVANILVTDVSGGAFQPISGDPCLVDPTQTQWWMEIGGFDFVHVDVFWFATGQTVQLNPISRVSPSVTGSGDNFNGAAVILGDASGKYGPPSQANTWQHYTVPLANLGIGFTTFQYTLNGGVLTVSKIVSGPGLQGSAYLSGPGFTSGNAANGPSTPFVLATNPGNPYGNPSDGSSGTYQIGPVQGVQATTQTGHAQRSNYYKTGWILSGSGTQQCLLDNWRYSTY